MRKFILYLMIFPFFIVSCNRSNKKGKPGNDLSKSNPATLVIKGDNKNLLQLDSIFSDIYAVPLETNDNCLITQIDKVMFYQEKMLLKDHEQRLLVFNLNGKFLYEISKQGRGPGEFGELRDFDIDKEGNIYILQYQKILKYDISGKFLRSYSFSFSPIDEIYCNPLEFALKSNGNFFIWGASFEIDSNPEGKLFAMYEMTKEGKIVNKYFPLKHIINGEWAHRFRRFEDLLIMNPVFGSNTVYAFDSVSVRERYFIDFGKKTQNQPVPDNFTSIRDFRAKTDESYFNSISKFIETDEWIYFMFAYKMRLYNVYFSKILDRSFVSTLYPTVPGRITPSYIEGCFNNKFISFINSKYLIEQIDKINVLESKALSSSENTNIEKLRQLKITDNPIMLLCSLKKY